MSSKDTLVFDEQGRPTDMKLVHKEVARRERLLQRRQPPPHRLDCWSENARVCTGCGCVVRTPCLQHRTPQIMLQLRMVVALEKLAGTDGEA